MKNSSARKSTYSTKEMKIIESFFIMMHGEHYLEDSNFSVASYGGVYKTEFFPDLKTEKYLDLKKIDLKKILLLAYYFSNMSKAAKDITGAAKCDFFFRKHSSYIKDNNESAIIFVHDNGETVLVNSRRIFDNPEDFYCEKYFEEEERILLKGYCRIFSVDVLCSFFNLNELNTKAMKSYLTNDNTSNYLKIYSRLIELPIKGEFDFEAANKLSFFSLFCKKNDSCEIIQTEEAYKINLYNDKKDELLEDLKFLKTVVNKVRVSAQNDNNMTMLTLLERYDIYFDNLKNKSREFQEWKKLREDPLYLIKLLVESRLYIFEFGELTSIFKELKKEFGEDLDDDIKKSVINLLELLYKSKNNSKDNNENEMANLFLICDIDAEELDRLYDGASKKGTFKTAMIRAIKEKQLNDICQMDVKSVRRAIDELINSDMKVKKEILEAYINRLKELKKMDPVTIWGLIGKGYIKNADVLSYAKKGIIDTDTLNMVVCYDSSKKSTILNDFSEGLETKKLADLYVKMRNPKKGSSEELAKKEFEIYAKLYNLYKENRDKEIDTFITLVNRQKNNKQKNNKQKKDSFNINDIVYLYENGVFGYEHALQPNTKIYLLNGQKNKTEDVNKNIEKIVLQLVKNGTLRRDDAKKLFKEDADEICKGIRDKTTVDLKKTLLGRILDSCSLEKKLGICAACEFDDVILNLFLQDTTGISVKRSVQHKPQAQTTGKTGEEKKGEYEKIPVLSRLRQFYSLDIPDLTIPDLDDSGTLCLRSNEYNICIIEQVYKKNRGSIKAGEHYTYVLDKTFFDEHGDEILTIKDGKSGYDFSALFSLSKGDKEHMKITRVSHTMAKNNPGKNRITWENNLLKAIKIISGRDVTYRIREDLIIGRQ